jgi:hypothetical protein
MYKKLLFLLVLFSQAVIAQQLDNPQLESALQDQVLNQTSKSFFIRNKGQWNPEVKYLARIGGMNAWITNSGVVYDYYKINKNFRKSVPSGDETKINIMNPKEKRDYENNNTAIQGHVIKMQLLNAEKNVGQEGNSKRQGYYNYFIGNDQNKWASFVPLYDNVDLQGVYKNIDVKYYYENGTLRYDYKVKPGAEISQIKFMFEGQDGLSINSNGELILNTSIGEVTHGKIYAYQMEGAAQKEVDCKFEQRDDGTIGLKALNFDAKKELIIDPLVYSTFIGGIGNNNDQGKSIAVDAGGNVYITGYTGHGDFPIITGAYQDTLAGFQNAFVTKLNSTGTALIYSTFIGGNYTETGTSIAVDAAGDAYITGSTRSKNYPTTKGAFQTSLSGTQNVFVTKLNAAGSSLLYSSYLGGNNWDYGNSIAIDTGGSAYLTGYTASSNYPTTVGAFQTTFGAKYYNVFVTKFNSAGAGLVYSTFIGGNNYDVGNSIVVDLKGNAYVAGYTGSSNYPTTAGAFQTNFGGGVYNAFVTKLNSAGSALVYSSYVGGSNFDQATSITVDTGGNAYITGNAQSSNYPTTVGAFQTALLGSGSAFVTKLNSTGGALAYSTFIGGNNYDYGTAIVLDDTGSAYITGYTSSSNYPTTIGAYQTTLAGYQNAFISNLNSTGSALAYSTFIGGNSDDLGFSIALDKGGNAYIDGATNSSNFPITNGAYQTNMSGGGSTFFVTKLNLSRATSIQLNNSSIPGKYELSQNYPNPFNPGTVINYALPFSSSVKIEVYNVLGENVTELLNAQKTAGYYSVNFNTTGLASGVYLYMISAKSLDGKSEYRDTKKMVLLK